VVGDRPGDLELAWKVGARGALVKTGYGLGELTFNRARFEREPDLIAEHLLEAVSTIVAQGSS
jgi:D-glycero-D-manno-heptose 1,7-bisphosphate phosphatase